MSPGTRSHALVASCLSPYYPDAVLLASWIPYFPIPVRKAVLSCCQMRLGPDEHTSLWREFIDAWPKDGFHRLRSDGKPEHISRNLAITLIRHSQQTTLVSSIISMYVRSADEDQRYGNLSSSIALREGILKELNAALDVFAEDQVNDYTSVFPDINNPPDTSLTMYYHPTPSWIGTARTLADRLVKTFHDMSFRVLYPTVQRRKNMSHETSEALALAGYEFYGREYTALKTVDLERFCYEEGSRIGGRCEMRWAWRFNDLKPRVYYAIGGDAYWSGRYMKRIAVAVMDAIPTTNTKHRLQPMNIWYHLDPEDDLIAYDYTSFTTNLSELKHFVYALGTFLKDQCDSHPLHLFDYREGIVEKSIGDLILEYNQECNIRAPFSIHRIVDLAGIDGELEFTGVEQSNGGMLGVPGNIGLSTSLHGLQQLPSLRSSKSAVSVGDDGLMPKKPGDQYFNEHMGLIGILHPVKFHHLPAVEEPGEELIGKFVKRRLTRTFYDLYLSEMFDIPIFARIFDEIPENRTVHDEDLDWEGTIYLLLGQVSSILWRIFQTTQAVTDDDLFVLRNMLRQLYAHHGLPFKGALPGYTFRRSLDKEGHFLELDLMFAVPSLQFFTGYDPRIDDWAEYLYDSQPQRHFLVPLTSAVPLHLDHEAQIGSMHIATDSPLLRAMEDIRVVKRVSPVTNWLETDEVNRRIFLEQVHRAGHSYSLNVYEYEILRAFPTYYDDVVAHVERRVVDPRWGDFWLEGDNYTVLRARFDW